jgi:hypothetical protein
MDKMDDTFYSRDYPVLLSVARRLEGGAFSVRQDEIARDTGLEQDQVYRALLALDSGDFIEGQQEGRMGPREIVARGISERGRREVGLWPPADTDSLTAALKAAIASPDTSADDRTKLRKILDTLGGVSKDIVVGIGVGVATHQINGGS